jgi:NAD(P)-dependent dehydrogenase (short-subunit alcohol dehydrogenase family)
MEAAMPDDEARQQRPPQHQDHQPGTRAEMEPRPQDCALDYKGSGKLQGRVALITGGDSGIGRSVAVCFAKEGADVAILYLNEGADAEQANRLVAHQGVRSMLCAGDVGDPAHARKAVDQTIHTFGRLDIVVNNAAVQFPEKEGLEAIKMENLHHTFRTNVYGMFYLTQAALPHMKGGGTIINTTSITAFHGNPVLIDYSSTKGAIVSFTRSLAKSLVDKGIRVNAVAPGPVWTPLIPASLDAKSVAEFGSGNPMGRAATADEISPCYVFLASAESAFMTGQVLHPNGGEYFG